jgi:hypothetical protein
MKRYGLVLTTLGAIFVTSLVLHGAGWFRREARGAYNRSANSLSRSALCRYRQGQPTHWRYGLLQR